MHYQEVRQGRTFVLRLEHGEIIHETVEAFAREQQVLSAAVIVLGGVDGGSRLVTGPKHDQERPVDPMQLMLNNVHEAVGTGTIFPNDQDQPQLHMHLSCGRAQASSTGCIRPGVRVWQIIEMVVIELKSGTFRRLLDTDLGFPVLSGQG